MAKEGRTMRRYYMLTSLALMSLLISGCHIPNNSQSGIKVNGVFTAAAQTLEAKLTHAPLSNQVMALATSIPATSPAPTITDIPVQITFTETFTPVATNTAIIPTQVCDAAQFVADITIPDRTILNTGDPFIKTWRLKNIGVCTWDSSYMLVFDVGDQMGGPVSVPLPTSVTPGSEVDISVNLQAPAETGSYRSYWRLRNPDGLMLTVENGYKGKSFYVDIQVKSKISDQSQEFAVNGVTFNVSRLGNCSAGTYIVAATVSANGAGEVSYSWKRSDGVKDPLSDGTLVFPTAGTQTTTHNWTSGATGLSMTLSIVAPSPREFGPALLNCP